MITFRETLEAALIVGIVLAFLAKTKNTKYNNIVYTAIGAGVVASIIAAILFVKITGGFEGRAEEIFEGVTMLIGAFLLTTMILWMMKNRHIAEHLKQKVSDEIEQHDKFGLFFLVFISVLREGIETVIFLGAASFASMGNSLLGGIIGMALAVLLGYLMFVAAVKINIKKFFNVSSFLLLLFAAGLVAHGVHELEEAKMLPETIEHVWDINPPAPLSAEGIYPALHEKGAIGSIAVGLLGYNGNPSLLEVISYAVYLAIILFIYKNLKIR